MIDTFTTSKKDRRVLLEQSGCVGSSAEHQAGREALGKLVATVVESCGAPTKYHRVVPWDELYEETREIDRAVGMALFSLGALAQREFDVQVNQRESNKWTLEQLEFQNSLDRLQRTIRAAQDIMGLDQHERSQDLAKHVGRFVNLANKLQGEKHVDSGGKSLEIEHLRQKVINREALIGHALNAISGSSGHGPLPDFRHLMGDVATLVEQRDELAAQANNLQAGASRAHLELTDRENKISELMGERDKLRKELTREQERSEDLRIELAARSPRPDLTADEVQRATTEADAWKAKALEFEEKHRRMVAIHFTSQGNWLRLIEQGRQQTRAMLEWLKAVDPETGAQEPSK